MKLLYVNANHSAGATTNALAFAAWRRDDILLLTEPYYNSRKNSLSAPGWSSICGNRSAILIRNGTAFTPIVTGNTDTVAIQIHGITLMVTYASPNEPIEAVLDTAATFIATRAEPVALCGDFNCRTSLIPGNSTNDRGVIFEDFLLTTGLQIWNNTCPTWHRGPLSGINDYICSLGVNVSGFSTLEEDSLSDHVFLSFTLDVDSPPQEIFYRTYPEVLSQEIGSLAIATPTLSTTSMIDGFTSNLTIMLQECIGAASSPINGKRRLLPWWTPLLSGIRSSLRILNRRIQRARNHLHKEILLHTRTLIRRMYRKEMARARYTAWRDLCTQDHAWGRAFAAVKSAARTPLPLLRYPNGTLCKDESDSIRLLLETKFPTSTRPQLYRAPHGAEGPSPQVTTEDITKILKRLPTKKAPGPDRICTRAVKALHHHHPDVLPALLTACLSLRYFPKAWRTGNAVFIPKPGKDPADPGSYRPITLLSTIGKLLERVLNQQINEHLTANQPLHPSQHGFRSNDSTEQAIHHALQMYKEAKDEYPLVAVVSLDIKGAFDHAEWEVIVGSLADTAAPQYLLDILLSYFTERTVCCGSQNIQLQRGCPQGSVIGPTLWNLQFDNFVRSLRILHRNICIYADDTLVILGAQSRKELQALVSKCIENVQWLLGLQGLALNIPKTEFIINNSLPLWVEDYDKSPITIQVKRDRLTEQPVIKYLGVLIDPKLNFNAHIQYTQKKCMQRIPLLQQIAHNTYGAGYKARKVMVKGFIYSLLHYASSVFAHRLTLKSNIKIIESLQRRCNIICCRGYRDLSGPTACLLAAEAPLHLTLLKRAARWLVAHNMTPLEWGHLTPVTGSIITGLQMHSQPCTITEVLMEWQRNNLNKWEELWAAHQGSLWTHWLFPTVDSRLRLTHQPTFWSSQAMSGHGVMKEYLHRRQRTPTPHCICGFGEESPQHIFMECPRFTVGRPQDWSDISATHITYMEKVIRKLWILENPLFADS